MDAGVAIAGCVLGIIQVVVGLTDTRCAELKTLTITQPISWISRDQQGSTYRRRGHAPPVPLDRRSSHAVVALRDADAELSAFRDQDKIDLLSKAFENIKHLKNGTLETLLFKATSVGFDEVRDKVVLTGRRLSCEEEQDGMNQAFRIILRSLAQTGLKISLLFGCARPETCVTIDTLPLINPIQKQLAESLGCLRALKIGLSPEKYRHRNSKKLKSQTVENAVEEAERQSANLGALVHCTSSLKELDLYVLSPEWRYSFNSDIKFDVQLRQALITAGPFPNLMKSTFSGFGWPQRDILAFREVAPDCQLLSRSKTKVKELEPIDWEDIEKEKLARQFEARQREVRDMIYRIHGIQR